MKKIISVMISLLFIASTFAVGTAVADDCCDDYTISKNPFKAGDTITVRIKQPCNGGFGWSPPYFSTTGWYQPGGGFWELTLTANVDGEIYLDNCSGWGCSFTAYANCPECSQSFPCNFISRSSVRVGDTFTVTGEEYPYCSILEVNGIKLNDQSIQFPTDLGNLQLLSYDESVYTFRAVSPGAVELVLACNSPNGPCLKRVTVNVAPKSLPMDKILKILEKNKNK